MSALSDLRGRLRCHVRGHASRTPLMHARCGCPRHGQFFCERCKRWVRLAVSS